MSREWLVIVNPNAGRRKGQKDWLDIAGLLVEAGIPFTNVFTRHRDHAVNIAGKFIEKGYRQLIVVGGDGTLNEVVNGIFLQDRVPTSDIMVGMIPVGTGNDWCRMFCIPSGYAKAVEVIKNGRTFLHDAGKVTYQNAGREKCRYFVNVAGMGYDALVAKKTNIQKDNGKGGPLSYLLNIFTSLFYYHEISSRITIDNKTFNAEVFSMNVGICKYSGNGMMQVPGAVPDDGLLDVTVIRKIGRFSVIRNVKRLYDGSFVNIPQVQTFTGKHVVIEADPLLYLEADGESLGHSPFRFDVIPSGLRVIVP